MARNDGIDRTSVRNLAVSDKAVGNTQQHNEREKDSYRNPDIIPQRAAWNVHFKKPTASYTDLFAQLEADGTISTRGLKPDATHYCELVFDVNSAYFDNHGGYEFAKQFYEDKKKKSNKSGYPDEAIKTLARCFYPSMVEFFNSEEGQREYEEWLKEQEALQALPVAA